MVYCNYLCGVNGNFLLSTFLHLLFWKSCFFSFYLYIYLSFTHSFTHLSFTAFPLYSTPSSFPLATTGLFSMPIILFVSNLFIYLRLHWVLVAAGRPSPVVVNKTYSLIVVLGLRTMVASLVAECRF